MIEITKLIVARTKNFSSAVSHEGVWTKRSYGEVFSVPQAFASQYTYCAQELGIDEEKINVNGGAMALGHPLGATGDYFDTSHTLHYRS